MSNGTGRCGDGRECSRVGGQCYCHGTAVRGSAVLMAGYRCAVRYLCAMVVRSRGAKKCVCIYVACKCKCVCVCVRAYKVRGGGCCNEWWEGAAVSGELVAECGGGGGGEQQQQSGVVNNSATAVLFTRVTRRRVSWRVNAIRSSSEHAHVSRARPYIPSLFLASRLFAFVFKPSRPARKPRHFKLNITVFVYVIFWILFR